MFVARVMTAGFAVLVAALPATAQQRGTMEFGAFGSRNSFENDLGMNSSWGGGGRIGMFVAPRLSVEFEAGGSTASRALGLTDVNVGLLTARLTAVPLTFGPVSVLLGAGVDHTDTHYLESYGYHGLVGAKFAISDAMAFRVDGIVSHLVNGGHTNKALHAGLSIYRSPGHRTEAVTHVATVAHRNDSVSAAETARLRADAAGYRALRDSLARPVPPSSASALAAMQQVIYFEHDKSDLSDSAKTLLRDKVSVFRANPAMRIVIVGFASEPGTTQYNSALGLRRAEAAKAYLVSQGIDGARMETSTRGEDALVSEGSGEAADASNRRGQFRLLMADPHLVAPKR